MVEQAEQSSYREAEISLGGALSRHDIIVLQKGPETDTALQCFNLVGQGQCHDLHSKVLLDHPGAVVDQLHKQIAAYPTSKGVFDGNVRVCPTIPTHPILEGRGGPCAESLSPGPPPALDPRPRTADGQPTTR